MATTTIELPTVESLSESTLAFLRRGLMKRGVSAASATAATAKGTDRWLTTQGWLQSLAVVLANNRVIQDAVMPDTAIDDDLDRICQIHGLERSIGAGAQGNVLAECSGVVTYGKDLELVSVKTGKRYRVISTSTVSNGGSVAIVGKDIGVATDLDPGERMLWTSPPAGSASGCTVDSAGLTNGKDRDTNDRLRQRLFKALREPQNGGSWAHYRKWAEDSSAAVENGYVFPAAQGPGTVHVAYTVEGTKANRYNRAGTTALTKIVANAIVAEQPEFASVRVTTVAHQALNMALKLSLPEPPISGGTGGGWVDGPDDRWAKAKTGAGDVDGVPRVDTVNSATSFVTNAYNQPLDGTTICIFAASDLQLYTAVVVGDGTGAAGSWTFNVDRALPAVGEDDYIFPACEQAAAYVETFMASIALLSPGEKTTNAAVLPRAFRHPKSTEGYPAEVTTQQLVKLQTEHPEVVNASYFRKDETLSVTLPLGPSEPSTVLDPPKVWRVQHLGFYPT